MTRPTAIDIALGREGQFHPSENAQAAATGDLNRAPLDILDDVLENPGSEFGKTKPKHSERRTGSTGKPDPAWNPESATRRDKGAYCGLEKPQLILSFSELPNGGWYWSERLDRAFTTIYLDRVPQSFFWRATLYNWGMYQQRTYGATKEKALHGLLQRPCFWHRDSLQHLPIIASGKLPGVYKSCLWEFESPTKQKKAEKVVYALNVDHINGYWAWSGVQERTLQSDPFILALSVKPQQANPLAPFSDIGNASEQPAQREVQPMKRIAKPLHEIYTLEELESKKRRDARFDARTVL